MGQLYVANKSTKLFGSAHSCCETEAEWNLRARCKEIWHKAKEWWKERKRQRERMGMRGRHKVRSEKRDKRVGGLYCTPRQILLDNGKGWFGTECILHYHPLHFGTWANKISPPSRYPSFLSSLTHMACVHARLGGHRWPIISK